MELATNSSVTVAPDKDIEVGCTSPRGSSDPGSPALQEGSLSFELQRSPTCHLMVTIKKPHITNIGEDVEKGNLHTLLIEMTIGTATMEKRTVSSKEKKKRIKLT